MYYSSTLVNSSMTTLSYKSNNVNIQETCPAVFKCPQLIKRNKESFQTVCRGSFDVNLIIPECLMRRVVKKRNYVALY